MWRLHSPSSLKLNKFFMPFWQRNQLHATRATVPDVCQGSSIIPCPRFYWWIRIVLYTHRGWMAVLPSSTSTGHTSRLALIPGSSFEFPTSTPPRSVIWCQTCLERIKHWLVQRLVTTCRCRGQVGIQIAFTTCRWSGMPGASRNKLIYIWRLPAMLF